MKIPRSAISALLLTASALVSASCDSSATVTVDTSNSGSGASCTGISVTSISPKYGATGGGTTVTLAGCGFDANTVVQLGGTTCIDAVLQSATQLTCKTGGHSSGGVNVTVTDGTGTTGTLTSGFLYYASLAISPVSVTLAQGTHKQFSETGGVGPFTYVITNGSGSLTTAGYFTASGSAGTSTTVQVTDFVGNQALATANTVADLAFSPSSVQLDVNEMYLFVATGGVSPYTFGAGGGGNLNNSSYPSLYYAPNSAATPTVAVTDSQGTQLTASVTVKAFSTNLDYVAAPAGNTAFTAYLTGPTGVGDIYVAGYGTDASTHKQWFVKTSANNGVSWGAPVTYQLVTNQDAQPNGLGADPSGNLYAVGSASDGTDTWWIVLKSVDNGASWSQVQKYLYPGGTSSYAQGIASDSSGNLYVAGYGSDGSVNHWLVQKSVNGGTSWSNVQDYLYGTGYSSKAMSIAVDASNVLWVCGTGSNGASAGSQYWIVETNSTAGTGSWTNSSAFQAQGGYAAQCNSIAVAVTGDLFAAGWVYGSGSTASYGAGLWYHGGSWIPISYFQDGSNTSNQFNGVGVSPTVANVYFVGTGANGTAGIIVKTNPSITPYYWTSWIEAYNTYSSGNAIGYNAVGYSSQGDPFVVGYAVDGSSLSHGLIRSY